jgi:hypothetical protein
MPTTVSKAMITVNRAQVISTPTCGRPPALSMGVGRGTGLAGCAPGSDDERDRQSEVRSVTGRPKCAVEAVDGWVSFEELSESVMGSTEYSVRPGADVRGRSIRRAQGRYPAR